ADVLVMGIGAPAGADVSPVGHFLLDEYCNMKVGSWDETLYPALLDSQGSADIIGVPEGRNHYYKMATYSQSGKDPDWSFHTWFTAEVLPLYLGKLVAYKEMKAAKSRMDPLTYEQEFEASFLNFEGRAYYCF